MRERIKLILDNYNINQTEFCNRTGIKKSALSHIMSKNGRGGSLSDKAVEKILNAFPNVNRTWLMTGDGKMSDINEYEQTTLNLFTDTDETDDDNMPEHVEEKKVHLNARSSKPKTERVHNELPVSNTETQQTQNTIARKIERIVIFYTDGTFSDYSPLEN